MPRPLPSALQQLRRLAGELGWASLERHRRRAPTQVITWYVSGANEGGRLDCFLQINECPIGQQKQYSAAVYAPRFRLCSGWHTFTLTRSAQSRVTARLQAWLSASHFLSAAGRRAYRVAHPETVGYSWAKISREGPPHPITHANPD
jgi:hypothetical protein